MTSQQTERITLALTLHGMAEDDFTILADNDDGAEVVIGAQKGRPKLLVLAEDGAILHHRRL